MQKNNINPNFNNQASLVNSLQQTSETLGAAVYRASVSMRPFSEQLIIARNSINAVFENQDYVNAIENFKKTTESLGSIFASPPFQNSEWVEVMKNFQSIGKQFESPYFKDTKLPSEVYPKIKELIDYSNELIEINPDDYLVKEENSKNEFKDIKLTKMQSYAIMLALICFYLNFDNNLQNNLGKLIEYYLTILTFFQNDSSNETKIDSK